MKYKFFALTFLIASASILQSQNVGIGSNDPRELLHLKSIGNQNSEILLESSDSTGIKVMPGVGLPYLHRIYRGGRFDQGILFYSDKGEIHTGWGKQFFNGTYIPYPTINMDDVGRTGIRMNTGDPSQALEVNGKIKISDDTFIPTGGEIKWDGEDFYGFDGVGWKSMTSLNDSDEDTKIYLHEGVTDSILFQANGLANQMIFDGSRLGFTDKNLFIGKNAGSNSASGLGGNIAIGEEAGKQLTAGSNNTLIGLAAGEVLTSGGRNTFIGAGSGFLNTSGSQNTFLGYNTGSNNIGTGNIFLGYEAGRYESGDNKLYISNTSTATPLIQGDFSSKEVIINDDLIVKNELVVEDIANARQLQVTDLNPILGFNNSGGASQFDFYYDNTNDRFVIDELGVGNVLEIKDGDIYLPELADNYTRPLQITPSGKLELAPEKITFNYYDFHGCESSSSSEAQFCIKGINFRDGQVLTKLSAVMADASTNHFVFANLIRKNKFNDSPSQIIYTVSSSDNGGNGEYYEDATPNIIDGNIIDNSTYVYFLYSLTTHEAPGVSFTWVSEISVE